MSENLQTPDSNAVAIALPPTTPCDRCGNYASLRAMGATSLCPECCHRALSYENGPMTVSAIVSDGARLLRPTFLPGAMVLMAFCIPGALIGLFATETVGRSIVDGLLAMLSTTTVMVMGRRAMTGDSVSVKDALGEAWRAFSNILNVNVHSTLIVLLFCLLLIVPGILRAMSYLVIVPIVLFEAHRGAEALKVSKARMDGARLPAFGALVVSILPMLGALAVLGIVMVLAGVGLGAADIAAGGDGTNIPEGVLEGLGTLTSVVATGALAPIYIVTVVIYARTRHRMEGPFL